MLETADKARGHLSDQIGLSYRVDLECTDQGRPLKRSYEVRSRGPNARAAVVSPVERKGDLIVMNDRLIWEFRSTSKRPVAVTLAERLSGVAAVGDIIATSFANMYTGEVGPVVKRGGEDAYEMALKATGEFPTYDAMRGWISVKNGWMIEAEFYSQSGKKVKTMTFSYASSLKLDGKALPFLSAARLTHDDLEGDGCSIAYGKPKIVKVEGDEFDVAKIAASRAEKTAP